MKVYGWLEVNLHAFWSSAINRVEILSSRPGFLLCFFISVFIHYTLFLAISLTSFPLFPFAFKVPLCFCSLFTLYFSTWFLLLLLLFFFISFFLSLSWSFIFCVLVMTLISGNSKLAIIRYFLPVTHRPLSVLIDTLCYVLQPTIQCID